MQPPSDIYVCRVTLRAHALCIFAESHFHVVKGCQQPHKTRGNRGKDRDLLCVGALLEVWHVMYYT